MTRPESVFAGISGLPDLAGAATATLPVDALPWADAEPLEAPRFESPYQRLPLAEAAWRPPPPVLPAPPISRWWWVALASTPALGWALTRAPNAIDTTLLTLGRLAFATAAALGIWLGATRQGRPSWRGLRVPAGTVVALALVGVALSLLAGPALLWRADQSRAGGDYASALALYQRAGDRAQATATQIDWSRELTDQGDFADAYTQARAALSQAPDYLRPQAQSALAHDLVAWGTQLWHQGDLAGARQKLSDAVTAAPGTADATQAAALLATPQPVTGKLVWLGAVPVPGVRVALISDWHVDATGALAYTGERLEATTDATGTFHFTGARPGVHYAFIWIGATGDTVQLGADGQPRTSITLLPLAPGDLGSINI